MRRQVLLVASLVVFSGASLAQTTGTSDGRPVQREDPDPPASERLENAAVEVGEAIDEAGDSVEETLGLALTGCLIQGDETDPFILVEEETGDRITVVGAAELPAHVNHTVTLEGNEEAEGRVFHVTSVEHVKASCDESVALDERRHDAELGEVPRVQPPDTKAPDARRRGTTADDQGMGKSDVEVTRAIRQALTADDSLSLSAKNIKVITRDGKVTLRGSVKTEAEKRTIASKAEAVAGASRVTNALTVKGTKESRK